jgi:hypothetical protein
MNQEEWEKTIIFYMTNGGWENDRNDSDTIGFTFKENDKTYIRDYDKKSRHYVHYNADQVVNIRQILKEKHEEI